MTKPIRVEHLKPCADWWGGQKRKGRKVTEVAWKVTAEEVKARSYNLDVKNPHTVADDHGDPEELLAKLEEAEKEAAKLRDQLKAILEEALLLISVDRELSSDLCPVRGEPLACDIEVRERGRVPAGSSKPLQSARPPCAQPKGTPAHRQWWYSPETPGPPWSGFER